MARTVHQGVLFKIIANLVLVLSLLERRLSLVPWQDLVDGLLELIERFLQDRDKVGRQWSSGRGSGTGTRGDDFCT